MSNQSVLFITPYFAPQVHAAVFRIHKLAKYLPQKGWKIHVLTVDTNYIYNENPVFLEELSSQSVFIHKARYIEPTLRGLRMWLGGQDRTFKKVKDLALSSVRNAPETRASYLRRVYQDLIKQIHIPDPYWTWKEPAIQMGIRLISDHQIPLIMTTSLPFTTIEIGAELKRKCGVKWVADFRDPMCYDARLHATEPESFARQSEIERHAVMGADLVTTLTSAHPLILSDFYGAEYGSRAKFIPTGIDTNLIPKDTGERENTLIFVGEFLHAYGDEFFRIYDRALKHPKVRELGLRLKIVGQEEVNRARIMPMVQTLEARNSIDFLDYRPQQEVYKLIQRSLAGVLCTSRTYPWWTQFAKMIDFIGLRKPVLAIVPDPSEGRKWLQRTNLGIFLDGSMEQASERLVSFLLEQKEHTSPLNEEVCEIFHVENQVNQFAQAFQKLISGENT